jgi:hypothetical protein
MHGDITMLKDMQPTTHSTRVHLILLVVFVTLFVFFIYTFLHEAGHAIVGLAFGQSLTEFNVSFWDFSAHVGMAGGELSQAQLAIQAIAGVTLPLLVWIIFIGLVPRKASFLLETLKLVSSLALLNTLLAWIVIPVLYIFGKAPSSDDVTNLLRYSQIPPLLLTFIVVSLYSCGWIYFLSKIDGLRKEFLLFRRPEPESLAAGMVPIISMMTGTLAFCLVLVMILNNPSINKPRSKLFPPPGFEVVAEVNLASRAYSTETLAEFALEEPTHTGVFVVVRDINTNYFDLSVRGPNGYSAVVLHGEGYRADRDGGLWEADLLPGTYQLVLTSDQSPGTASLFLKTR